MSSRISLAKRAYRQRNVELTKSAHSSKAIKKSISHSEDHQDFAKYITEAVYGALDGIVTTFAAISGVVGANLSLKIIFIVGLANILADGFSMGVGGYLSRKSEQEYHQLEYERELWEIENYPDGEKEEIRQIYRKKGFLGKTLDEAVKIITTDKDRWIQTMMLEELGISPEQKSPVKAGLITFVAFIICGFVPLAAFILILLFPSIETYSFLISCIITAITIFIVGSMRSYFIAKHWFVAGLEMLLVGTAAAGVAYMIGYFLNAVA